MNTFKHFLILSLSIVFASMACVSCNNAKSELESAVSYLNSKCPQSMGDAGEITQYTYGDGMLTIYYSVYKGFMNFDAIEANKEAMKQNIIQTFLNSDGEGKRLFNMVAAANAGITMVYTEKESGLEYRLPISRKDVAQLSHNDNYNPKEKLRAQVEITRLQCPSEVDYGMTLTNVELEGNYVVYTVMCDENEYDIAEMIENADILKDILLEYYKDESDPFGRNESKMLRDARVGVRYDYIGNQSGKVCMVFVENHEL